MRSASSTPSGYMLSTVGSHSTSQPAPSRPLVSASGVRG
ncbi:hypothetical protein NB713_003797 [Xanthomonas sacchari]|nr:hypothetical protein [Xanthomonas sacchari]